MTGNQGQKDEGSARRVILSRATNPSARGDVLSCLQRFADPEYQRRVWLRREFPPETFYDDLDDAVNDLFERLEDPTLVANPVAAVGTVLYSQDEAVAVADVLARLDEVVEDVGASRTDDRVVLETLEHPRWGGVVEAASRAAELLSASDRAVQGRPLPESRTYRAQSWTYFGGLFIVVMFVLVGLIIDTPVGIGVASLAAALMGWVFWWLIPRRTVAESPAGLAVAPLRPWAPWEVTPWDELEGFFQFGSTLYMQRRDGRRSWLPGLNGNKMLTRWDGGQTRDLVGELNARLALWQLATAPAEPSDPSGGGDDASPT